MNNSQITRSAAINDLQVFIRGLVGMLVDDEDQVEIGFVDRGTDEYSSFIITVANSDIGKVIGSKGKTIFALRTIFTCVSTKLRVRTQIELNQETKDRVAA